MTGRWSDQVSREPLLREARHLIERAGLFKEVGGAFDHFEALLATELAVGILVQIEDDRVRPADDEEGGRPDFTEQGPGKVRAAAAGDNRADKVRGLGGGDEGR